MQKDAMMQSEEYKNFQKLINEATEEQMKLLDQVPHSSEEYEEIKTRIMAEFRDKNLDRFGSLIAKFKTKNEVDKARLLQILDQDEFLTIATVTQTELKNLAKDAKYKPIRHALEGCIIEVSKEIVDIQFSSI